MLLTDQEEKCIQTLAQWFEDGETEVQGSHAVERMGLTWDAFNTLMRKMHHFGAVEVRLGLDEGSVDVFQVSPYAVQLARELDAEASIAPDFVEQIQRRLRRHPVAGWLIVIVAGLVVVSGLVANILSVLDYLGLLDK